ncbi:MAG: hypothetical protein EAZ42_06960 [Verrucomicrobia bacterium]|nr:MAG: hypothetical protein EAZ42_06960 [Verrucomicrobiota bacterium]
MKAPNYNFDRRHFIKAGAVASLRTPDLMRVGTQRMSVKSKARSSERLEIKLGENDAEVGSMNEHLSMPPRVAGVLMEKGFVIPFFPTQSLSQPEQTNEKTDLFKGISNPFSLFVESQRRLAFTNDRQIPEPTHGRTHRQDYCFC